VILTWQAVGEGTGGAHWTELVVALLQPNSVRITWTWVQRLGCPQNSTAIIPICMWTRKVALWALRYISNNCDYVSCLNILRIKDLESRHNKLHTLMTTPTVAGLKQANLLKNDQLLVSCGFLRLYLHQSWSECESVNSRRGLFMSVF
jgi:hypothetical protein